ncbi:MAG TPA: metal ABC transporter permease [Flexilinea sp.]|jgi:ABC-type Mn2+/Zn2+ transport system permease subunit|nr:metal ABC transporter permease [Flexilinea sp.]HPB39388.1 metal ABC transporter permease [Flexilinea sp.]HPJ65279.1 metal ABC transporter permease [Flexilinea sp.]HPL58103.1 metal ABC transporter permease [Flexilinea sp.]HPR71647.1 metal ABC transporter permease [Flexilinea sp.]
MAVLLEPFQYDFMLRSFAAAIMVGIVCSVIGTYMVVRSMAFLGDALAHAVLPGVAVAYIFGGNITFGAMIASIVVAIGISVLSDQEEIKEDTAIGIFFTAALALGIALISTIRTYAVDLTHVLFGNVLGVTTDDIRFILITGAIVLLAVTVFYRFFQVVTFDPVMAKTLRWNVKLIRTGLLVLIACTITISINTVGSGLVTAMLITPAATALMFTKKLYTTMLAAAGIGALSGFLGLYLSYFLNISSGAAIVLVATLFFIIVYFYRKLFPYRNKKIEA